MKNNFERTDEGQWKEGEVTIVFTLIDRTITPHHIKGHPAKKKMPGNNDAHQGRNSEMLSSLEMRWLNQVIGPQIGDRTVSYRNIRLSELYSKVMRSFQSFKSTQNIQYRLFLILLITGPPATNRSSSAPSPVALDIDSFKADVLATFEVPGVAATIVKDGRVVLARGTYAR